MRIALCLMFALVFLLNAPADAGQIYKWTDKNGQVHITQTPPPGVAAENVRGGSDRRDDPALQKYCVAVQNAARKVAYAAHSGRPMDDLLAQAEAIENDLLALGASRADIRQIVFFVYGMQSGLQRVAVAAGHRQLPPVPWRRTRDQPRADHLHRLPRLPRRRASGALSADCAAGMQATHCAAPGEPACESPCV